MKKILLLVLLAVLTSCSKPGVIEGVVTYFFNKYQGDKPDIGAVVYATTAEVEAIKTFLNARRDRDNAEADQELIDAYLKNIDAYTRMLRSPRYTSEEKQEYRRYIEESTESIQKLEADIAARGLPSDDEFSEMASAALRRLFELARPASVSKIEVFTTTVDATGRYRLQVPKGYYNLVFVSKGRQRINSFEIQGQVITETVSVGANQNHEVSVNFEL